MTLLIQQAKFELHQKQTLNLPHFAIEPRQYWVVVGSNGSGKSAFALALQNELSLQEGKYHNSFQRVQSLSFEKQREIIEATLKNIKQNLFFALIYNVLGIPLAALGYLSPVLAGAAMAMSSLSVLFNALRLKRVKIK